MTSVSLTCQPAWSSWPWQKSERGLVAALRRSGQISTVQPYTPALHLHLDHITFIRFAFPAQGSVTAHIAFSPPLLDWLAVHSLLDLTSYITSDSISRLSPIPCRLHTAAAASNTVLTGPSLLKYYQGCKGAWQVASHSEVHHHVRCRRLFVAAYAPHLFVHGGLCCS